MWKEFCLYRIDLCALLYVSIIYIELIFVSYYIILYESTFDLCTLLCEYNHLFLLVGCVQSLLLFCCSVIHLR